MLNRNRKGFTLVEIMIVVAIIALLATIAIPGILRSRQTANESNAIATLKSIATASETYRAAQTTGAYPANLTALSGANPPYISGFSGTTKAGYNFTLASNATDFFAAAAPTGGSNMRYFCTDESGDVWANNATYGTSLIDCSSAGAIVSQ